MRIHRVVRCRATVIPSSATRRLAVLAAGVLALVLAPAALSAAEVEIPPEPDYRPPVWSEDVISLSGAVRVTLENDPAIHLAREDVAFQRGFEQELRGAFDLTLIGELNYEYTQQPLTQSELSREQEKRDDIREEIQGLQSDIGQLEGLLDELITVQENPLEGSFSDPELDAYLQLINFLVQNSEDPDAAEEYATLRDEWLAEQRAVLEEELFGEQGLYPALDEAETRLEKLGPLPHVRHDYSGSLTLDLRKPFRSGFVITPFFEVDGQGGGYNGKKKDTTLGGTGQIDTYGSRIGIEVQIPLGRGRGVESTGAPELAAGIDVVASEHALVHAASVGVLRTMLAYWDLVAAQETLAAYERSLALQGRLVDLTESLIEGDEIPPAERPRIYARQAEIRALVEETRRSVHQARLALARQMGLQVQGPAGAPFAGDGFPAPFPEAALEATPLAQLAQASVSQRYDYRAAEQLQRSGKVLWRKAVIDLAPVVDLNLEMSYAGAGEHGKILEGLQAAVWDKWAGPSARVGLNLDVPMGNNTQQGQLAQRRAAYRRRAISTLDLARVIKNNVVLVAGSLLDASRRVRENLEAVRQYQQAVDFEMEKFQLGSSTLIDTIFTEQRLTDAEVALVASQRSYAQLLSQVRFETATLVEEADGEMSITADLLALPTVAPAGQ